MTHLTFGQEGTALIDGTTFMEMEPRVWYPVAAGVIVENQLSRPLLVSDTEPTTTIPAPTTTYDPNSQYAAVKTSLTETPLLTWPSPHFRTELAAFTICAGEKRMISSSAFMMSTTYRVQPVTTSMLAELPDGSAITGGATAGIELGSVEVGCVPDAVTGETIGKVFLVIQKGEDGITQSETIKAVLYSDGSIIDPYVGTIAPCTSSENCDETFLGMITDTSVL